MGNRMGDLISRKAAIEWIENIIEVDKYYHPYAKSRNVLIDEVIDRLKQVPSAQSEHATCYLDSPCEYQNKNIALPSVQSEPLTDKEQRIFLAAMGREEKVCKQVDDECRDCMEPYEDSLVRTCHEITRKVKGALWT